MDLPMTDFIDVMKKKDNGKGSIFKTILKMQANLNNVDMLNIKFGQLFII